MGYDPNIDAKTDDRYDMVGQIVLKFSAETKLPSLVVTGPTWPVDNINPTVELYWDPAKKKLHVKAGATTTARLDSGDKVKKDDDDHLVDLTELPDELKKLVPDGAKYEGPPATIPTPTNDNLWQGDHYMSYEDYCMAGKTTTSYFVPKKTSPWVFTPIPGTVDIFNVPVGKTLYPPLSAQAYEALVNYYKMKRIVRLPPAPYSTPPPG